MIVHPTIEHLDRHLTPREYNPPVFHLPHEILHAWHNTTSSSTPKKIFTDGSVSMRRRPIDFAEPRGQATIGMAMVFTSREDSPPDNTIAPFPRQTETIHALHISGVSDELVSYDTEQIIAALASTLPYRKIIKTDCCSVVTHINNKLHHTFDGTMKDPATPISQLMSRDGSEKGTYDQVLLYNCRANTVLEYLPAHSESRKDRRSWTWDDLGNQTADSIACGDDHRLRTLLGRPSSTAIHRVHLPLTQMYTDTYHHIAQFFSTTSGQKYSGTSSALWAAVARTRINEHIRRKAVDTPGGDDKWLHRTWNLTATILQSLYGPNAEHTAPTTQTASLPSYLRHAFKILYGKFHTEAFAITSKRPPSGDLADPPQCILCNSAPDSLTHLFCECPRRELTDIRSKTYALLCSTIEPEKRSPLITSTLAALVQHAFASAATHDSRHWCGLFSTYFIATLIHFIAPSTRPFESTSLT